MGAEAGSVENSVGCCCTTVALTSPSNPDLPFTTLLRVGIHGNHRMTGKGSAGVCPAFYSAWCAAGPDQRGPRQDWSGLVRTGVAAQHDNMRDGWYGGLLTDQLCIYGDGCVLERQRQCRLYLGRRHLNLSHSFCWLLPLHSSSSAPNVSHTTTRSPPTGRNC
jgi:hypothetical protein